MTHRERFFEIVEGRAPDRPAFFPDISSWYVARKTPPGQPQQYKPGDFIPDEDRAFHAIRGDMPRQFRDFTWLDFYKEFDWGLPVHLYDWCVAQYDGVEETVTIEGNRRITRLRCSKGELAKVETMAEDGSWAPTKHFAETMDDLDIMRHVVSHKRFVPDEQFIRQRMEGVGDRGVCDTVIFRSPFGKLVHEYLGFEQVVYALHDDERAVLDFLEFHEQFDLEVIRMAAKAAPRVVVIGDHADQTLISPHYYRDYCIPYYHKANAILHEHDKLVSTHLDGNFKGYFPMLADTRFDILDGCTPAPMSDYEVEELAAALPAGMSCYLGVPSSLFAQGVADEVIVDFGRRILDAFGGRVLLNVGDVLPTNGNIDQTIKLGEMARHYRGYSEG